MKNLFAVLFSVALLAVPAIQAMKNNRQFRGHTNANIKSVWIQQKLDKSQRKDISFVKKCKQVTKLENFKYVSNNLVLNYEQVPLLLPSRPEDEELVEQIRNDRASLDKDERESIDAEVWNIVQNIFNYIPTQWEGNELGCDIMINNAKIFSLHFKWDTGRYVFDKICYSN